jgi:hypothetical protein
LEEFPTEGAFFLVPNNIVVCNMWMNNPLPILNEREARDAKATVAEIQGALSSEKTFQSVISGLPVEVVESYRHILNANRFELLANLDA